MPIQPNNIIMSGTRGTLGKQVVFRQRNGKTFVSAYPDMSNRVLSEKQLKVNAVMAEATAHAKEIMADIEKKHEAQIRLDLPSNRIYTALVREYFKENYKKEEKSPVVPAPAQPIYY